MKKIVLGVIVLLLAGLYVWLHRLPAPNPFVQSDRQARWTSPVAAPGATLLCGFERGLDGVKVTGGSTPARGNEHTQGKRSLQTTASFSGDPRAPGDVEVKLPSRTHWGDIGRVLADLRVRGREGAADRVQVLFFVKTTEDRCYQRVFEGYLPRGRSTSPWVTLSADLTGDSPDWLPAGHRAPWGGYSRQFIQEFSIRLYSKQKAKVDVFVDNVRSVPLQRQAHAAATRVVDLYPNATLVPRYGKFELTFHLSKTYRNPFDPDEVDVHGVFISPSGKITAIPGFFYQAFERRMANGVEQLAPVGPKCWKVRFCPTELGAYRYSIRVREGDGSPDPAKMTTAVVTPQYTFQATPSASKGFIRVSAKDRRYFEYDNGAFFYPIGMNAVTPWDSGYDVDYVRPLPRGKATYAYDEFFEKMNANGANWVRMWMANWWVAIEWTRGHGPYLGLGRYSLDNAWRIDHILSEAQRQGVYIDLTLINHVKFNTAHGWRNNPYNRSNGGPCRRVNDFFTNETAKHLFKKRLRYIIARWAYSTHLFAWDLWSEAEFAPRWLSRLPAASHRWHHEMFDEAKQLDPWGHLMSTHFNNHNASDATWHLRQVDFVHATLWPSHLGAPKDMKDVSLIYDRACMKFRKPYMAGEFGGHWGGSSPSVMERELHAGLWRSLTLNAGGTPMFWWWNFLHNHDLYFEFRGLAKFLEGEDLRGRESQPRTESASSDSIPLEAYSIGTDRWRLVWVADPLSVWRVAQEPRPCRGARLRLSGLQDGKYHVEVWRTAQGRRIAELEATAVSGALTVELPEFQRDLACKVRKVAGD